MCDKIMSDADREKLHAENMKYVVTHAVIVSDENPDDEPDELPEVEEAEE